MAAAAMGAILLLASCGMEPSEPCPTDDALIAYLDTQRAELEKLVANPWDEELRSATKVLRVEPGADGRVQLWMWHHDFPGPGGVTKGYVHGEAPTRPLVDSIDDNSDPGGPEDKDLFRHIEGDWYLFYRSHN
jgi:hypothetical protein